MIKIRWEIGLWLYNIKVNNYDYYILLKNIIINVQLGWEVNILHNDTKINDFDVLGVLILEPFFWGNLIFKICSFCIKSHVWGREEFLWEAPPECNAAKLRYECFSLLFMLDNLLGEATQWKIVT